MSDGEQHALCSPSGAKRWLACPGSVALEATEANTTSEFADEGTRAHKMAAEGLFNRWVDIDSDTATDLEMVEAVRRYCMQVKARVDYYKLAGATTVTLLVEQKLDLSPITGEKDARGTADHVIIAEFADHSVLEVGDLKYGKGVAVGAVGNEQLQMYALAAMLEHSLLHDFTAVVLAIYQVRLHNEAGMWETSPDTLYKFGEYAAQRAAIALACVQNPASAVQHLEPTEDGCRFCRAKAKCPALAKAVHATVMGEFQKIDAPDAQVLSPQDLAPTEPDMAALLPLFMERVGLIEDWCAAVRAEVERRLLDGKPVAGWKLVEGRKGARAWTDTDAAEKVLIAAKTPLADIYTPRELLGPAKIERVVKSLRPDAWQALQGLIRQADGKPSVAPAKDPRPVWSPQTAEDFEDFSAGDLI